VVVAKQQQIPNFKKYSLKKYFSYDDKRNSPISANKFGKSLIFLFFLINAESVMWMLLFLQ
jgi:hypothetical protein